MHGDPVTEDEYRMPESEPKPTKFLRGLDLFADLLQRHVREAGIIGENEDLVGLGLGRF